MTQSSDFPSSFLHAPISGGLVGNAKQSQEEEEEDEDYYVLEEADFMDYEEEDPEADMEDGIQSMPWPRIEMRSPGTPIDIFVVATSQW